MWLWDHPPTECDFETTPHWMWLWDHPPLNVIVRPPPTECDFETTPHRMWFWDLPPPNVIVRPPPTECGFETTPHRMWFWDLPPPNVILRGHTAKSVQRAQNSWDCSQRAITVSGPSVYHLVSTPDSSFLTVTRLKSFLHTEVDGFQSLFSRP